ncbi:MAG TPA: VOC family protein [Falsiroseomonas sp.]|jgi:catechol 2,3-dioxygenase|nr:VOC family protein [Falsiroseomonas sp.]
MQAEEPVMDIAHLGHVELLTPKPEESLHFFTEVMGMSESGRFHPVTFALDSREAILQAADTFLEAGVFIETGPHKHAVQQTFFLYVYEPGGNRVDVAHAGARLVLAPDWKTITWTEAERRKGQAWGLQTIGSFHTHGTPPLHGDDQA